MGETEKYLWGRVYSHARFLQAAPFVEMLAVCNNLAFGTVNKESDIDLFIIAKKGRIFTARIFVTFLLQILGVRRYGNKIFGRFCLSFFVDEGAMDLSKIAIKNDIYLAYWIKSMLPVIDDEIDEKFIYENGWIKNYFDDGKLELDKSKIIKKIFIFSVFKGFFEFLLSGGFGNFIEKKLKKWQMHRAKKKASMLGDEASILISDHMLKFHNVDKRKFYRDLWIEKYGDAKISKEKFILLFS